ncbi:Iron-containing redox enzyme [Oryzisolibacter propanilivorax]|uniref:Iron-containing redox enzyme n=1 Tax=Oryzisolibacter propanilivorax TaxID=1527607 RepID=A0A1G9RIM3_9BURK|nr:iron-containing redox enzyme family protein [Oryzisolibacter propanilivorax]SDM23088.1 Iron-containing redox enzyme [Oryzisolibacter propanilivorax]
MSVASAILPELAAQRAEPARRSAPRALYHALLQPEPDADTRTRAAHHLRRCLLQTAGQPSDLPERPQDLHAWRERNAQQVAAQYEAYLAERRAGGARRYFGNRAHALHFLRAVAPTKLVDGAWLYGLTAHAENVRLAPLVHTYLEELGDGAPSKNHVLLYRRLLARHGIAVDDDGSLPDALYQQGLIQLALGWNAEEFLPEVIGFNLAYEQLPLHLLITSYELNELGLDPYYFTLHVTVDNGHSGHARQACDAVLGLLPRHGDTQVFWQRVRAGARLADAGVGTTQVIRDFDIGAEVLRILAAKAPAGHGAHSNYCRVAGRSVNDWLADAAQMPQFLQALVDSGWVVPDAPPHQSRFWRLLQGERAEMFGVFSAYELQVIHDWLRGEGSSDGQAWDERGAANQSPRRRPSFRAMQRAARVDDGNTAVAQPLPLDPDIPAFEERLRPLQGAARRAALVAAMAPGEHWTPTGLHATRLFRAEGLC